MHHIFFCAGENATHTTASATRVNTTEAESSRPSPDQVDQTTARLQETLIALLASLDRGFAAGPDDILRVDTLVRQLETSNDPIILQANMARLGGRWRLLFSSSFAGGNLGGARPGPPAALFPLQLGQVYQDIFLASKRLDNVVSLSSKISIESLPAMNVEPPSVTCRLGHSFEVLGANTVRITYDDTEVKGSGGIGGWLGNILPGVKIPTKIPTLPEPLRSVFADAQNATFEVVFIDDRMRITRGDRGELRVFLRETW